MRKTDGFTLVELMVGILCSTLVTGAIITFMLMGMNTNRSVLDANANQRNAKIIISMVENLASEGSISKLEVDGDLEINDGQLVDDGDRSWTLCDKDNNELLYFSPADKTIYGRNRSVLMEGVNASMLSMSKAPLGGCILGFGIQTDDSFYKTSVYNRVAEIDTEGIVLDENNFAIIDSDPDNNPDTETPPPIKPEATEGRIALLKALTSQYGSTGTIIVNGTVSPVPYSLWYNNGKYPVDNDNDPSNDWGPDTPWCAIFLSWGFAQIGNTYLSTTLKESNVDRLWTNIGVTTQRIDPDNGSNAITPGDLIFFDWDRNTSSATNPDLEHVGVVLYVDTVNHLVYTIEGNSGNRVALRRYDYTRADSGIYGYGILDWNN